MAQHATRAALLAGAVACLVAKQAAGSALEGAAHAIAAAVHPAAALTGVRAVCRDMPVHVAALAERGAAAVRRVAALATLHPRSTAPTQHGSRQACDG